MIVVNTIVLIFAIINWVKVGFSSYLFWIGFAGSIFDTIGKVVSLVALEYGPGGVSIAIGSLAGPGLVLVVALVDHKMIKASELIALMCCMFGSFFLVVPELMYKILLCRCFQKPEKKLE